MRILRARQECFSSSTLGSQLEQADALQPPSVLLTLVLDQEGHPRPRLSRIGKVKASTLLIVPGGSRETSNLKDF